MTDSEMFRRIEAALGGLFARGTLSTGEGGAGHPLAEAWRQCCLLWSPSHPAAVGCLRGLVREAWRASVCVDAIWHRPNGWDGEIRCFKISGADVPGEFTAEEVALVVALERREFGRLAHLGGASDL